MNVSSKLAREKTIYVLRSLDMGMHDRSRLRLVAYCGLYCGLCAQRTRIPDQALQLQRTLHEEGFDDFYQSVPEMKEAFPVFWDFLRSLAKFDCMCRTGKGGPLDCEIRGCAKRKNILVCPTCNEYPCRHIRALAAKYPTLIQDGKRLRRIGIEKWVIEQEQRVKRGFAYADIRYPQEK